ncbi:MAG: hypothetical protein ABF313_02825 [Marivita sp.]
MADLIYIGIRPSMDTFESNATNEQPGAMYGTYQATAMQVVSVAMSDNFTPGSTYSDDFGATPDTFTYNLGSGTITSGLDGEARFSGSVITAGSTTPQPMTFSVYQLQNGATFVRLPDGYEISQLTISSMVPMAMTGLPPMHPAHRPWSVLSKAPGSKRRRVTAGSKTYRRATLS